MNKRKFLKWLKTSLIRAVKTTAQAAIASLGTSAVMAEINWVFVLSTAGIAGLISLLMSLEGLS